MAVLFPCAPHLPQGFRVSEAPATLELAPGSLLQPECAGAVSMCVCGCMLLCV